MKIEKSIIYSIATSLLLGVIAYVIWLYEYDVIFEILKNEIREKNIAWIDTIPLYLNHSYHKFVDFVFYLWLAFMVLSVVFELVKTKTTKAKLKKFFIFIFIYAIFLIVFFSLKHWVSFTLHGWDGTPPFSL